jgi:hypothetical protein
MDEQQLILIAETGNNQDAQNAMDVLRSTYDPSYTWCSECDYIVVKEKDCCLNNPYDEERHEMGYLEEADYHEEHNEDQ